MGAKEGEEKVHLQSDMSKPKAAKISSLLRVLVVSFVVVIVAVVYSPEENRERSQQEIQERLFVEYTGNIYRRGNLTLAKSNSIDVDLPKHKTDIVAIEKQYFLKETKCGFDVPKITSTEWILTRDVMNTPPGSLRENHSVFLMLNGENKGLYFTWNGRDDCLYELASIAATALGANPARVKHGVRLMSQYSIPLLNATQFESANRIAHILLPYQLWVWPGIEEGYIYRLNNISMITRSLSPRVFSVYNFFTQDEANEIIAQGQKYLHRSPIGENAQGTVSEVRTSYTAFLPDTSFSRDFQHRSTNLARLPSASYAERLQLVRYRPGQFYRKHLDTMASKNVLAPIQYQWDDYITWATWAQLKIDAMGDSAPDGFKAGQELYPNPKDLKSFPRSLLRLFLQDGKSTHFFESREDQEWQTWIEEQLEKKSGNPMRKLLKADGKPEYLRYMIRTWEHKLHVPHVQYLLPNPTNGMSNFLQWIRWAKEQVSIIGDSLPASVRPGGKLYPSFGELFQYELIRLLFKYHSKESLIQILTQQWYDFLVEYKSRRDCIHILLQQCHALPQVVADVWSKEVDHIGLNYQQPDYVHHTNPNRFVTLFLYLNSIEKGGGTVFPFGQSSLSTANSNSKMDECSRGLNVPATGLGASLFYTQTPDQEIDPLALHGGCPPENDIKWGSNSFMWNADATEGTDFWT